MHDPVGVNVLLSSRNWLLVGNCEPACPSLMQKGPSRFPLRSRCPRAPVVSCTGEEYGGGLGDTAQAVIYQWDDGGRPKPWLQDCRMCTDQGFSRGGGQPKHIGSRLAHAQSRALTAEAAVGGRASGRERRKPTWDPPPHTYHGDGTGQVPTCPDLRAADQELGHLRPTHVHPGRMPEPPTREAAPRCVDSANAGSF